MITHGGSSRGASNSSIYAFMPGRKLLEVNLFTNSFNNGVRKDFVRPFCSTMFWEKELCSQMVWQLNTARVSDVSYCLGLGQGRVNFAVSRRGYDWRPEVIL